MLETLQDRNPASWTSWGDWMNLNLMKIKRKSFAESSLLIVPVLHDPRYLYLASISLVNDSY